MNTMRLPSLRLLDRLAAEQRLAGFVRLAWPILEPRTPLSWNWHLDLIIEHLEAVARGDILRLILNCPPRNMKSILVSVMLPTWSWIAHPELRWLFSSYAKELSLKLSTDRRTILTSDVFKRNWPGLRLKDDSNRQGDFENQLQGAMRATSVGASVTGLGGDIIISDDTINPAQADSEAERTTSPRWFDESLSTRLNDKKTGRIIVVEQRTNQEDLTGHLLAQQGDWVHLNLPAEFERRTTYSFPSGRELVCEEGSILWPEREGRAELDAAKQRIGSFAFQSQYLGEPTARGGNLFQLEWLREFHSLPTAFDKIVLSLDTAFSVKETADYSAAVVVGLLSEPDGEHAPGFYVIRTWRGRVTFGDLKQVVVALARDYQPDEVLIEDKASGQSLIQELMADTALPVIAVDVDTDKVARANAVSPLFESGRVFFPEDQVWLQQGGRWVRDLRAELLAFPHGKNDDQVDALVHALNRLRHHRDQALEWAKQLARGPTKPGAALAAYEKGRLRAAAICTVCGRPIPIIQHAPVYTAPSGGRCCKDCQNKVGRTETIRGEQWPAPRIGGAFLIPNNVRLR